MTMAADLKKIFIVSIWFTAPFPNDDGIRGYITMLILNIWSYNISVLGKGEEQPQKMFGEEQKSSRRRGGLEKNRRADAQEVGEEQP
ncbi:hypothetical protein QYF36_005376 [Acer negundo]|nr:hypothetical protein QYF36_005376 [Acer negundo]